MYVKVQFRQNSELNLENQRMSYLKSWIFYEYESLQKKLQKTRENLNMTIHLRCNL